MDDLKKNGTTQTWMLAAFIVFAMALLLRLNKVESIPFTRADADLAMQAWDISYLKGTGNSSLPAYTGITGLLFWLGFRSVIATRILPAFLGASLTLIPWFWLGEKARRKQLGIALILALDPFLIIFSRQIDGPIIPVAALAWVILFYRKGKTLLAGVCLALALLGGPYFFMAVALLIIYGFASKRTNLKDALHSSEFGTKKLGSGFLISLVLSLVLVSTSFFLNPKGLSGITESFLALFQKQVMVAKPFYLPVFYLFTYSLYLVVGILLTGINRRRGFRFASLGILVFLIVIAALLRSVYPGFYLLVQLFLIIILASSLDESDLAWQSPKTVTGFASVFFLVILVFSLLTFSQFARSLPTAIHALTDLLPAALALVLVFVSYFLIGLGWGFDLTKPALNFALLIIASLFPLGFSLSYTWQDASLSQLLFSNSEIIYPDKPIQNELDVFLKNNEIKPETALVRIESPVSIGDHWEFRHFTGTENGLQPAAIILNDRIDSAGSSQAYRGTSIRYTSKLQFSDQPLLDLIHMLSSKELPTGSIMKTLWVQTAYFPGGE